MTDPREEELRKEFVKLFTFSHPGDSGFNGGDPQEPVYEIKYEEGPDEIWDWFISKIRKAREEERESMKINVGMLRQWLNEDRIKDGDRFVTNEQINHWLALRGEDKEAKI